MAKKISFEGLQPEYLSNEKTWLEFMEALADTIQEQIRDPIGEIEDIRHIVEDTDPEIISNTIKQLGFDIPADLIAHNVDRLAKSVYMLALFHEISGTKDFVKGVQYVLGRELQVRSLWTNNYLDFYTEAGGPRLAEGGDWYKTTHIELGIELLPSDVNLILPEDQTLTDRLLSAYFEFAPINHVVKDFYFIIPAKVTVGLAGKIYVDFVDIGRIGYGSETVMQVETLIPEEVLSGEIFQVLSDVRFDSDSPIIPVTTSVAPDTAPKLTKQKAQSSVPVVGVLPIVVTDASGIDFLDQPLESCGKFTLNIEDGHYGYLACPVSLGKATISEVDTDNTSEWRGADADTGYIVVTREVNGEVSDWYLYRTSAAGLATKSFRVTFDASDLEADIRAISLITSDINLTPGGRVVRVSSPEYSTDRPDLVRFDDRGRVIFAQVTRNTTVAVTTTVAGISDTKNVVIKATGARLNYIRLHAPDIIQGEDIFDVSVDGYYSDGHVRPLHDAKIRALSPYILQKQGYSIDTGNPPEDTVLYLEATVIDRSYNEHRSTKDVILKSVSLDIVVTQMDIVGPGNMTETTDQQFQAHAYFSDGTDRVVLVLWESSSPTLHIDQEGLVTAGKPQDDFTATLKATFQYKGIKHIAIKQIEIVRSYITPVSLAIMGQDRVVELTEAGYTAFMTWSNNAVTVVNPEWTCDRFSIDQSGILTAGSVGNAISVSLQARAQGLVANKTVAVYDTPIAIEHITVIGPENLKENIVGKYRAFAHFNDGRDIEVTPDWSIVNTPAFADITEGGMLTFSTPTTGIIEIYASFDNGIKVYTQTKPIVLIPNVSIISGLIINGPSEVLEGKRINLTATAMYEDGSMEVVQPVWGARSPDPLNNPEPAVDTVSPGVVQGRSVEEHTVAIITARFFKEVAEFPIIVKNYDRLGPDTPLFSRIIGPSAIRTKDLGSYSLLTVFDNGCDQEIAISNDWSLNVPPDIAVIDQNGFLRSVNGETVEVTISADWAFAGHSIHEEYVVRIGAEESPLGDLRIYGPNILIEQSITMYTLELFRRGQPSIEGTGEVPTQGSVEWILDTQVTGVNLTNAGELFVADVLSNTEVVIRAVFTEGFYQLEVSKVVTIGQLVPVYGTGPVGISEDGEIDQYLNQDFRDVQSGEEFSITASTSDYIYFAAPVAYGLVTFFIGNGISGGMEGATWPNDGGVGTNVGPLTISRTSDGVTSDWYLYRSDFSGIGTVTLTVNYNQE